MRFPIHLLLTTRRHSESYPSASSSLRSGWWHILKSCSRLGWWRGSRGNSLVVQCLGLHTSTAVAPVWALVGEQSGLPRWLSGWRICLQCRRCTFDPWVREISWRKKWQPTPVFLPGESHRQRSLVGYSPWGCKESDTTEVTECTWAGNKDPISCTVWPKKEGARSWNESKKSVLQCSLF